MIIATIYIANYLLGQEIKQRAQDCLTKLRGGGHVAHMRLDDESSGRGSYHDAKPESFKRYQ